jgi:prophage regulatory protein
MPASFGPAAAETERLIRLPETQRITGLGRSQIYLLAARGEFPRPLKISTRCSAWVESDVRRWIATRIAAARKVAA